VWDRGLRSTHQWKSQSYTRDWGVQGCWEHDMRLISVPNADSNAMAKNALVAEETAWEPVGFRTEMIQETGAFSPDWIAKKGQLFLREREIVPRRDQVLLSMMILAVSPEYLREDPNNGEFNEDRVRKWTQGSIEFLRKRFGESLLSAVIHLDESNPHMSAYVVPAYEKDVIPGGPRLKTAKDKPKEKVRKWCLSNNDLFTRDPFRIEVGPDGKKKKIITGKGTLSLLQDEYASHLEGIGLEIRRGVRRAPHQRALDHETNKLRYERLSAPVEDVKTMAPDSLKLWAINAAPLVDEASRSRKERNFYQIAAADAQQTAQALKKNLHDSQRSLPVFDTVRDLFGIKPLTKKNSGADHLVTFLLPSGQRIGVDTKTNCFENLTPDLPFQATAQSRSKGRGAIDVITYLTGWNLIQASEWIADKYSKALAKQAIAEKFEESMIQDTDFDSRVDRSIHAEYLQIELERSDATQWDRVASILQKQFRISRKIIDTYHEANWINANKFGHLVVTKAQLNEKGGPVPDGNFVVHLDYPEDPLKETGENGATYLREENYLEAILCASPIEALVLRSIPGNNSKAVFVIGTPAEKTPAMIEMILSIHRRVTLYEDASTASKPLADWMEKHFPGIKKTQLPEGYESWIKYHMQHAEGLEIPEAQ